MSKTKMLLSLSAISIALGLAGCNSTPSCDAPNVLNDAGTECVLDQDALIQVTASQAVVYYKRQDGDYTGWGLHLWGDEMATVGAGVWDEPITESGIHPLYGAYYIIDLTSADWTTFNFIVHSGGDKDIGGADLVYSRADFGTDVFLFQGVAELFPDPMIEVPVALTGASAHFIDVLDSNGASIVFQPRVAANQVALWHSATAELAFDEPTKTVSGGTELTMAAEPMSAAQTDALPHLADLTGYWVDTTVADAKTLAKGQLWVVESNSDDEVVQLTRVQTANLLDSLYSADASLEVLGASVDAGETTFAVWAPTATDVDVNVYNAIFALTQTLQLVEDTTTGVWSLTHNADLTDSYYLYDVDVFHHTTDAIEEELVTDPYSLSLSVNSLFSQVVDLDALALKPTVWTVDKAFADITNPEDIAVYETHIRDISLWDATKADAAQDGTFMAFTDNTRESMQHLNALRTAGMTAVQILPAFDIATINEDDSQRVDITDTVADYCAISDAAEAKAIELGLTCDATVIETALAGFDATTENTQDFYSHLRSMDSFNWGYDPFHYTVPEGSYSTDATSTARILEFREMVQALHDMDYMVVMDVVYNHTNSSGLNDKSVLDKLVPGYYHRRDIASGAVLKDSCCDDTATEHDMMSKLMVDSLVVWARDYQVDAFRFDLMGLQTLASMEAALTAVQVVNPDVYFYGEGWDYGAAGSDGRGVNASQSNIAGTQIGTFTDRLRDGVRGGGPFDNMDGDEKTLRRNQGLSNSAVANELNLVGSVDPDAGTADDDELTPDLELEANVLANADLVRLGLAGNLKTFGFKGAEGTNVTGTTLQYGDSPAGYAGDPQEIINYVSKHDNQTLWDIIAYKADLSVTSVDRARMQALALATSTYAQGVPFYHMGAELLRSKSMERDSYDSGDWFNKVDFAIGADSNWNVGLPREDKDGSNWDIIGTIIADTDSDPTTTDVTWMRGQFLEMLEIRADSPLFRLTTADEINGRISFHNTGADQTAGVIAMSIDDGVNAPSDLDANYEAIVVIFNYTNASQDVVVDGAPGFTQHTTQTETTGVVFDGGTSTFTVPALTTAIFVANQGGSQGDGIPAGDVAPYASVTFKGGFTGWNDVDMFYQGEGIYKSSYLTTADAVDSEFGIVTDGDFNSHDQGVDFTGSTVVIGGVSGNATVSLTDATRYEFTYDASANAFSIALEADALFSVVAIRSEFIDSWGTDLAFDYLGLNRYEINLFVPDADVTDGQFGIDTDGTWNAHDEGVNFADSPITIGGSSGNATVSLTGGLEYDLFYDSAAKLFTIEDHVAAFASVQINASFISWAAQEMVYTSADAWSITLAIATDVVAGEFGILTDGSWNAHEQGVDYSGSAIAITGTGNALIDLTGGESYIFTYDATTHSVTVELVI